MRWLLLLLMFLFMRPEAEAIGPTCDMADQLVCVAGDTMTGDLTMSSADLYLTNEDCSGFTSGGRLLAAPTTGLVYCGDLYFTAKAFGIATLYTGEHFEFEGDTGVDVTLGGGASGVTVSYVFDATEISNVTWGAGSDTITWTFDVGGGTCTGDGTTSCTVTSPDCDVAGGVCNIVSPQMQTRAKKTCTGGADAGESCLTGATCDSGNCTTYTGEKVFDFVNVAELTGSGSAGGDLTLRTTGHPTAGDYIFPDLPCPNQTLTTAADGTMSCVSTENWIATLDGAVVVLNGNVTILN